MDYLDSEYPLHHCVYTNSRHLETIIKKCSRDQLNRKDQYGNTALHIASMLNHEHSISSLLDAGCQVNIRNKEGWRAIDESISCGNIYIVNELLLAFQRQMELEGDELKSSQKLLSIPDTIFTFKWKLKSWVPFVSSFLPSDECKLYKKGNKIRLDTSLLDFKDRRWVKGQLSIILDAEKPFDDRICILNHVNKCYQRVNGIMEKPGQNTLEKNAFFAINTPIYFMNVESDEIGWKMQESKTNWNKNLDELRLGALKMYSISNVKVIVKKRCEHLTKESLTHRTKFKSSLRSGDLNAALDIAELPTLTEDESMKYRLPIEPRISWHEYRNGDSSADNMYIGRQPNVKCQTRMLKLSVAMADDVGLPATHLLDLFQIFSPLRKFQKLRSVINMQLPPGFPISLDVPVLPTIVGRLVFTSIQNASTPQGSELLQAQLKDEMFSIPEDFTMKLD